MKFSLSGDMIPRSAERFVDLRHEPRVELNASKNSVVLMWRGASNTVQLVNISLSGAMLNFDGELNIGELVELQMGGGRRLRAHVMWIRDGSIGVSFINPFHDSSALLLSL